MRFLVWATTQHRAMHKAATRYPQSRGFKVEVIDEKGRNDPSQAAWGAWAPNGFIRTFSYVGLRPRAKADIRFLSVNNLSLYLNMFPLLLQVPTVVRRFVGDHDVVDMAFPQPGIGDLHEVAVGLHLGHRPVAGVAHRGLEPAYN